MGPVLTLYGVHVTLNVHTLLVTNRSLFVTISQFSFFNVTVIVSVSCDDLSNYDENCVITSHDFIFIRHSLNTGINLSLEKV